MRQVPMEQIRPGEKIRVDAGNVIPVDGTVLSGEAEVNQAAMTGESEAASKREGSVVFAGTTLETGSLVIRVDAAGDQSRINNIIALIDHSEELKARIQSRAEKLADSIVPYTLLTAGALFLFTRNISKALSVLMVDYSCAIKLATPISVISAMKEAAARKIMIKGGKFMELFAKTDTIVFDKTGTLTSACPQVTQIIPLSDCSREYILKRQHAWKNTSPTAWRGPLCAKRWRRACTMKKNTRRWNTSWPTAFPPAFMGKRFLWAATIFSLKMNASPSRKNKG